MKQILFVWALLTTGFVNAGGAIVVGGFDDKAIRVSLSSPGDGIDIKAKTDLIALISEGLSADDITTVTAKTVGFEGDIIYCVQFPNSKVMSQYFDKYNAIILKAKNASAFTAPSCDLN